MKALKALSRDEGDEIMRKQIINNSSYFPRLEKSPTCIQNNNSWLRIVLTSIIIIIL